MISFDNHHVARTVVALAVAVLTAFFVVRSTAGEPVTGDGAPPGFRQMAETDQGRYAADGPVRMTFTVCRATPWPTVTHSTGGRDVYHGFRVLDEDGEVVADTTHEFHTLELRTVFWAPGQCRSVVSEWDQHHWNREPQTERVVGRPVVGDRVEPGTYRFEAWWMYASRDIPGWAGPPVETEPFTIGP